MYAIIGNPTLSGPTMSRLMPIARKTTDRRLGQSHTKRRPVLSASSRASPLDAAVDPRRINANVASETTKLSASTRSAAPIPVSDGFDPVVPSTATTRPAAAGPIMTMSWFVPWLNAFAAGISSGSTTAGMIACWAGKKKASATPKMTAQT